jgi:hypothetical protein
MLLFVHRDLFDWRFAIAYNAALQEAATAALSATGYRPVTVTTTASFNRRLRATSAALQDNVEIRLRRHAGLVSAKS